MLIADLLMLTALYHLLQQKTDKVYWTLFFLMFVAIVLNAGPYYWGWRVGGALYEMLLQLSVARISFLAIRRKKRGAWIIAAGALFYVILFPLFLAQGILSSSFLLNLSTLRTITYVAARFSIPIATSIYLGLDIAFTSRRLQKKLIEVNQLSEKTLAQEQEKQEILANQKKHLEQEVLHRTNELTRSLEELKATQSQLIQKEKMASLGELTAGIAHEIQNPLNFVNNFSDVNAELVDELQAELKAGNTEDAFSISNEIKDNEQKINHHGKRADAIVKGMLQHSRASSGKKEPIDINALADEYLRLSYHGLRAKDKDFNADFKTDFDETIGNIEVVPQDIGRVLLNLYNNAFYAVYAKKKQLNGTFEPTVEVSTKRVGNNVMITVKDNGTGIPQKVLDKIYQPFFTTKPTGQGTGLGLSLSYDIIKAHGGEIRVESKEGEYTECVVQLPGT
jgi:signal transduction histidine kinase